MRKANKILPLVFILSMTLLLSCGKKNNDPAPPKASSYPKEVSVEYRVTSPSGLTTLDNISRINSTGANEIFTDQALPYTAKFDMTVNQFDALLIGGTSNVGGTIECEILVDGKSVDKKSASGNSFTDVSAVYVFE